ncbi:MAG: transglutaminase-like domain-containing protein [Desulfomonilaceae bacterium]
MYFQNDKVGYSHFKIEPASNNFSINTDSFMRLKALRKVNEVKMKERVVVRPDLTLVSFQSVVRMNGKDMTMTGKSEGRQFLVDITVEGEKESRQYPLNEKIYPSSAISLMPALRGLKNNQSYTFDVFNAEKLGMQKVDQQMSTVKGPAGPNGAIWKVKNTCGQSVVDSWLDKKGLTVIEKALQGSLITMLEDENTAEKFVKDKAQGKDLVLDVSLIRIPKPLPHPEKLHFLKARLQGVEQSVIPEDRRQKITVPTDNAPKGSFDVAVRVEDPLRLKAPAHDRAQAVSDAYLAPTISIQSNNKEIVDQAKKIVSPHDSPLEKVLKLTRWTAENIKSKMTDNFSALSVLHRKEGECQSHASLYTALARSQGIPTRIVTGIVYSNQGGFLYHAWCESYLNGWVAVDPTLKQIPADATHIKISSGASADDSRALLKMVGKVKLEVLKYE